MTYIVTFYASDVAVQEAPTTIYRVPHGSVVAYIAPGIVLAAAQSAHGKPKPCGYRIVDSSGTVVLDYGEQRRQI